VGRVTALERVAAAAGVTLFDYQVDALGAAIGQPGRERLCLYHRTGAGKTLTSLLAVAQWGWNVAVVVAPPATHSQWVTLGQRIGVTVEAMSHAKFRMKGTKLSRKVPVIADEMHMFGGHKGQGWKKLEGLAKGLDAPLVMASATPNYNDAERVYCIQRVLDPLSCKGGFIEFIYRHCTTEQDPFSATPIVTGFHHFANAEEYLAALPGVAYLPDELVWSITDVLFSTPVPWAYEVFGYNERKHKIVASGMEDRHTRTFMARVDVDGFIHDHVFAEVLDLIESSPTPVLVYCNHSTIALALEGSLTAAGTRYLCVTGDTSKVNKARCIELFKKGGHQVLIGTATLATGTDGIDKMCDRLIILDDTDDDSLRRQLVGRIMPRGADSDASMKQVFRLLQQ
jgi:superfamily II DNA or RNA helicase